MRHYHSNHRIKCNPRNVPFAPHISIKLKSGVHAYQTIGHNICIFHKTHTKTMRGGYFDIRIINDWNQLPSEVVNPFAPHCAMCRRAPNTIQQPVYCTIHHRMELSSDPSPLILQLIHHKFHKNISVIFKMLKLQKYEEYEPNSDGSDISYSQKRKIWWSR